MLGTCTLVYTLLCVHWLSILTYCILCAFPILITLSCILRCTQGRDGLGVRTTAAGGTARGATFWDPHVIVTLTPITSCLHYHSFSTVQTHSTDTNFVLALDKCEWEKRAKVFATRAGRPTKAPSCWIFYKTTTSHPPWNDLDFSTKGKINRFEL